MRRSTELECVVQCAELSLDILLTIAGDLECLLHDIRVVVTNCTGGELNTVTYDVVLVSEDLQRILVEERIQTALGHRERIVCEVDLVCFCVQLVHGEVHNEAELKLAVVNEIHAVCDLSSDLTCKLGCVLSAVSDEVQNVADLQLAAICQLLTLSIIQELIDRTVVLEAAVLALLNLEVAETLHAHFLSSEVLHVLEEALGLARHLRNTDTSYALVAERLEIAVNEQIGQLLDNERVTQIGLICTIGQHSLCERNTSERRLYDFLIGELLECVVYNSFSNLKYILLLSECHLKVELVELTGGTILSCILITEARCDLEVAIKAACHK